MHATFAFMSGMNFPKTDEKYFENLLQAISKGERYMISLPAQFKEKNNIANAPLLLSFTYKYPCLACIPL